MFGVSPPKSHPASSCRLEWPLGVGLVDQGFDVPRLNDDKQWGGLFPDGFSIDQLAGLVIEGMP